MIEMSFGTMDMIFSGFDPDYFSVNIRQGALDQVLLRPVECGTQIFGSASSCAGSGASPRARRCWCYAFSLLDIHWTPAKLAYLPVVFVSQVIAFGSLFMAGSTFVFWTIQRGRGDQHPHLRRGGNDELPVQHLPRLAARFLHLHSALRFPELLPRAVLSGQARPAGHARFRALPRPAGGRIDAARSRCASGTSG